MSKIFIDRQSTTSGNVINHAESITIINQVGKENKHQDILDAFDENTLVINGYLTKDFFTKISDYLSEKIKTTNRKEFYNFLNERDILFKPYNLSINLAKFAVSYSFLSGLGYTSNLSNICLASGTIKKIYNCTDGLLATIENKDKSKVVFSINKDYIFNGTACYVYGRAEKLSDNLIRFHIHNDYIHSLPCKYGNSVDKRIIDSKYTTAQKIDILLGKKLVIDEHKPIVATPTKNKLQKILDIIFDKG